MFRPPRAAAAAAGKKIKRNIEEILLSSDVKENYHRADLAVRIAAKKGKCIASTNTATTTAATNTTLNTTAEATMMPDEQPPCTKKAKTTTTMTTCTTTVPSKNFDKTPPPPARAVHSKKNAAILTAVENGPILGRATALLVHKTMDFADVLSPIIPQVMDFAKRVRRHT